MTIETLRSRMLTTAAVALAVASAAPAAAQIKIVAYNTFHNPDSTGDAYWNTQLANYGSVSWHDSYYGAGAYGTIPQRPAIMALTEANTSLQEEPDSVSKVATILNSVYGGEGANYLSAQIHAGGYEDYAFVYDSTQVELLDTATVGIGYRPAHRGHFRPVGYTSEGADFYVYNVHLKAYPGYEDQRLSEVSAMLFRAPGAADELPEDANIIYAGDFNFTTSWEEGGYDLLLDPNPGIPNPGVAFDPLAEESSPAYGGSAPSAYSTYSATGPWSRIDFQFPTTELGDGEGMDYIDSYNGRDSLHAHGNRNGSTSGYQAAQFASDHLPVIADYQVPAWMSADAAAEGLAGRMIVGADAAVDVTVENVAPATVAAGADELEYAISGSGVVLGAAAGVDAALGGGNTHALALDTSTAGAHTGEVLVTSDSPAVEDGAYSEPVGLEVLDRSQGSFAAGADVDQLTLELGAFAPSTGAHATGFDLHNLTATAGYTAALELDSVAGAGHTGALATDLTPTTIAAGGAASFEALLDTSQEQGLFSAQYTLAVSDEDLPGAAAGADLLLELTGYVAIDGDLNLDRRVNDSDLGLLLSHLGQPSGAAWSDGDINGDGAVGDGDLGLLLANFGAQAVAAPLAVPEPAALAICLPALVWQWKRRRGQA